MKRRAGCLAAVGLLSSAVAVAAAPTAPSTGSSSAGVASVTMPVGPHASDPAAASAVPAPASPASSASQTVTGVVASTIGVAPAGAEGGYRGTEPAMMTVARNGSEITVTVVPR